jgi:hypothetical protein
MQDIVVVFSCSADDIALKLVSSRLRSSLLENQMQFTCSIKCHIYAFVNSVRLRCSWLGCCDCSSQVSVHEIMQYPDIHAPISMQVCIHCIIPQRLISMGFCTFCLSITSQSSQMNELLGKHFRIRSAIIRRTSKQVASNPLSVEELLLSMIIALSL